MSLGTRAEAAAAVVSMVSSKDNLLGRSLLSQASDAEGDFDEKSLSLHPRVEMVASKWNVVSTSGFRSMGAASVGGDMGVEWGDTSVAEGAWGPEGRPEGSSEGRPVGAVALGVGAVEVAEEASALPSSR
jgi:hypothetical protein